MLFATQWTEYFFSFIYWTFDGFKGHFILNSKWTPPNGMIYFFQFVAFVGVGIMAKLFNKNYLSRSHYYNKYLAFMPGLCMLWFLAKDNYTSWVLLGTFIYFVGAIYIAYKNEKK